MQACISQHFEKYMDDTLDKPTKTSNGQTRTTNLADTYLQEYLMAWQARDDDTRHGHDIAT